MLSRMVRGNVNVSCALLWDITVLLLKASLHLTYLDRPDLKMPSTSAPYSIQELGTNLVQQQLQ